MKTERQSERYYTRYTCQEFDVYGQPKAGTEQVLCFADSSTILGIRVDGKLLLSEAEAEEQICCWNETDDISDIPDLPKTHFYSLYRTELKEAGSTPRLPGMSDRDLRIAAEPRTEPGVGHVVGQGGRCWCGEHHRDAVSGDQVILGPASSRPLQFLKSTESPRSPETIFASC